MSFKNSWVSWTILGKVIEWEPWLAVSGAVQSSFCIHFMKCACHCNASMLCSFSFACTSLAWNFESGFMFGWRKFLLVWFRNFINCLIVIILHLMTFLTFSDLLEYFVVVKLFDSSKLVRSNIDVLSTRPRLSVFVEALMSKNHHEGT